MWARSVMRSISSFAQSGIRNHLGPFRKWQVWITPKTVSLRQEGLSSGSVAPSDERPKVQQNPSGPSKDEREPRYKLSVLVNQRLMRRSRKGSLCHRLLL